MPNAIQNTWKTVKHRNLKVMSNEGARVQKLMMDFVYSGKLFKY